MGRVREAGAGGQLLRSGVSDNWPWAAQDGTECQRLATRAEEPLRSECETARTGQDMYGVGAKR